jgi:hypothetical protein
MERLVPKVGQNSATALKRFNLASQLTVEVLPGAWRQVLGQLGEMGSSDEYGCAQDGSGAGGRDRGRRAGMRELVKRWRVKRMPGWRKTSGRTYAMAEQG